MSGLLSIALIAGVTILIYRYFNVGKRNMNMNNNRYIRRSWRIPRIIWVPALVLLCVYLLSGCYASALANQDPTAVVMVVSRTANQNEISSRTFESAMNVAKRAVHGGDVSVIVVDGSPRYIEITDEDGIPVSFEEKALNNLSLNSMVRDRSTIVENFIMSEATRAVNPEVDLLAAIKEAERTLHDIQINEKHIIIIATGVSTSGRIDMTTFNLDELDVVEFISMLSERDGILPDLSGINITFYGLGDTALPQIVPDTTMPKLESFWRELLLACGAESITFPVSARGTIPNIYSEDDGGFPYVSVVNFEPVEISIRQTPQKSQEIVSDTDESSVNTAVSEEEEIGELILPNVHFKPDTATLIDENAARGTLKPYADAMAQHLELNPLLNLYLVGTTATTTPGGIGDITLSQNRSDRLMELLVDLGVPGERLHAIGVGANVPAHLRVDEFANGSFDTVLAQANRKATVYEMYNPDFRAIIAHSGIDLSDFHR